jgi:hypothetical protein
MKSTLGFFRDREICVLGGNVTRSDVSERLIYRADRGGQAGMRRRTTLHWRWDLIRVQVSRSESVICNRNLPGSVLMASQTCGPFPIGGGYSSKELKNKV